jgi:pimeloyl-ACP methyl ester carboxylesterase
VTDLRSVLLIHGVSSSHLTWWRIAQDLTDLDWRVHTVDLLGHGDRADLGGERLDVDDLARDVLDQLPGPVDLVAAHSLGAIVALTAAAMAPDYTSALVIEDPPGLSGSLDLNDVADRMTITVEATRADPTAALEAALRENPTWTSVDASNSVRNRLRLDLARVSQLLRAAEWDLPSLVAQCPMPLHLLAATRDSALVDPDRAEVMSLLSDGRTSVIDSGHDIHRERPGMWLQEVLRFAHRDQAAAAEGVSRVSR